jgi:hypothetical protein
MSIDRRLRETLLTASQEMEVTDLEVQLRRAVARARPREVGRAAAIVALAASLVAGVFAAGAVVGSANHARRPLDGAPSPSVGARVAAPDLSTPLDGMYGATIRTADGLSAGLTHAEAYGLTGAMELVFARDTVQIHQQLQGLSQLPVFGSIEVSDHRLVVHQGAETLLLDWRHLPNDDLRFTIVDDTRGGHERLIDEVVWTSHPWRVIDR